MWKSRIYIKDPPENIEPLHIIATFLYHETRKNRGDLLCFNVTKLFLRTLGRYPRKVELYATNKLLRKLSQLFDITVSRKNRRYFYTINKDSKIWKIATKCSTIEELEQKLKRAIQYVEKLEKKRKEMEKERKEEKPVLT